MKKIYNFIAEGDEIVIKKVAEHVIEIEFDKIYDNVGLKDLNRFVMTKKPAYSKQSKLYCQYINYFIKNYDEDNELLVFSL